MYSSLRDQQYLRLVYFGCNNTQIFLHVYNIILYIMSSHAHRVILHVIQKYFLHANSYGTLVLVYAQFISYSDKSIEIIKTNFSMYIFRQITQRNRYFHGSQIHHYKEEGVFQNFDRSISPIHAGRIAIKLYTEIPVHHALCV